MTEDSVGSKLVPALFLLPEPASDQSDVPMAEILDHKFVKRSNSEMHLQSIHVLGHSLHEALGFRDEPVVLRSHLGPEFSDRPFCRLELVEVHIECRERVDVPG